MTTTDILPPSYADFLAATWRTDAVALLREGLRQPSPVSIRLNAARGLTAPDGALLTEAPDDAMARSVEGYAGRVAWCGEGIYLERRPTFTADPLLHAGAYYVQEASSMFVAHVVRHIKSLGLGPWETGAVGRCLDLCAAPGGKTTLLRSLLPTGCLLIANEPVRQRAMVLAENVAKWGQEGVRVTTALPRQLVAALRSDASLAGGTALFDLVVADVPCSGEGMFRKEDEARRQWSPRLVAECAALQRDIAHTAWEVVRPGGCLIYSTCTFNAEECEGNVMALARDLGAELMDIPVEEAWGVRRFADVARADVLAALSPQERLWAGRCYHFIPGAVRGEGFFCAALRKGGGAMPADDAPRHKKRKGGGGGLAADGLLLPTDQIDTPPGMAAGSRVPRVELTAADALRYLSRESLVLPPEVALGIVQVCHRGQRLGFVKNIGSRANNLYPKEWRVRSGRLQPHSIFL